MSSKLIVHLYGEKHTITCETDETVLDAALKAGMDAPYSCMSGTCNSCQAKLLSGKVEMEFSDALTEQEILDGEILTCQAKVLSPEAEIRWPE
jgi:3-ketosteroid 9alpha-monooxygenase subunit B